MNAKYCKLIRKVVRQWGYSDKVAKRIKKTFLRNGIRRPSYETVVELMEIIDSRVQS